MNSGVEVLKSHGIKPSLQRLKILDYLDNNSNHPTVDNIYRDLEESMPTLSRTTVYNTLKLFVEKGLMRALNIDDGEQRFDYRTDQHAHFKCLDCGKILDVEATIKLHQELVGYSIADDFMLIQGWCDVCNKKRGEIK